MTSTTPDAVLAAFEQSAGGVWITRDAVDIIGPDAAEYLQGQLSQDVAALAEGQSRPSLVLQPQGKVDAWGRLTRLGPEHFRFDLDAGHGDAALARLQRFKLRVDCELTVMTIDTLAVRGPAAAGGPEAVGLVPGEGAVVVDIAWPGVDGFDVLGPVSDAGQVVVGPAAALEALRIRRGVPAMGAELDDGTIPAAAGIVDVSVDFDKGCYVGQELVARIDSRGANTPTHLRSILVASGEGAEGPKVGDPVVVDGAEVGTLTSVTPAEIDTGAERPALAYIRRAVEPPVDAVVTGGGGERPARIAVLPVA